MPQTIDLRRLAPAQSKTAPHTHNKEPIPAPAAHLPNDPAPLLSWTVLDQPNTAKTRMPYVWLSGATLCVLALGAWYGNYSFVIFIIFAYIAVLLHILRKPRPLNCTITHSGIRVGRRLYHYAELKSFCVFDRSASNDLSLETSAMLTPYLLIPLGDTDLMRVRRILRQFLKEATHKELFLDILMRRLQW
jgi:hypothetical protein